MRTFKTHSRSGFALGEVLVAIVCLGVALTPLVMFFTKLVDLNSAVGEFSRRQAIRSWQDQVMSKGINPAAAAAYSHETNPAVPGVPLASVTLESVAAVQGSPMVAALRNSDSPAYRVGGSGFELGAGSVVPTPGQPIAPLPPIQMLNPSVTPVDLSVIPIVTFAAALPGQPYTHNVSSSVTDGGRVFLQLSNPSVSTQAVGLISTSATSVDFANGVGGKSWNEYAGNSAAGDISTALSDGRQRWFVPVGELMQPYDPSPFVTFTYLLSIGSPVLVDVNGVEQPAASSINVDYLVYLSVQKGAATMRLDWPAVTKQAFGGSFGVVGLGFNWTFESMPGAFSGDMNSFFQPPAISLWADFSSVHAAPVVPVAVVASSADWILARVAMKLSPPELATLSNLTGGTFASGPVTLEAPFLAGSRLGRISASAGGGPTAMSTTETLSVTITPNP